MSMSEDNELPVLKVKVVERGGSAPKDWMKCQLGGNLQFSPHPLASYFFAKWEPIIFDALLVAAAVEFCDRVKKRPKLGWGLDIHLKLPVHDPAC